MFKFLSAITSTTWLWIVGGLFASLIAIIGVQAWRLNTVKTEYAQLVASTATDLANRATAYAAESEKTAAKEQTHAATTQGASDAYTQTKPLRDAAVRSDLQRARRLLDAAEKRAASYRAQSEAGAAACSRLADRAKELDQLVGQGLELVAEGRGIVEQRDAEVTLLRQVIDADRALMGR